MDRRRLLDVASGLLAEGGPAGLTMRAVAAAAGTSTMVLYSRFGGREALVEALLAEGFSRFAQALGAASAPEPAAHLLALGHAYRRFALDHPTYFRLMWSGARGSPPLGAAPSGGAQEHAQQAFSALLHAVTRVLAADDRPARDAEPLAHCAWAAVHGFVSLELSGVTPSGPSADALFERTLRFALDGLRSPQPGPTRR
ncbi:MAG: TetR/AcrR family transcriptional regulator [Myxococcaceae bacterium]|nr:TetR/AcrR family transcriptional regulator [Myxococcaceae bacterium]MCA3015214.1 TetR/AcrR family transcriptional regulator [Myxococcaceae bacterium]